MRRTLCKSKIQRETVTDANLEYEGSITLDPVLMEAADIVEYERVQVVDINNGSRLETYVIRGQPGRGEVVLNGAAARLVQVGDRVIIMSYAAYEEEELEGFEPRVVLVDEANHIRPEAPRTNPSQRLYQV
ncbi:MAG: aspartate 1-decarboxylase [Gemmatimonadota bacterium]